jgi:transposase InsO family protein
MGFSHNKEERKMTESVEDPRMVKALCRYEVVGRYLAMQPKRGQRRKLLEQLASQNWLGPEGALFQVAAETIRVWVRQYRKDGLPGLMDKKHEARGIQVLTEEQTKLLCQLKKEVPERSLERIIEIAEQTELVEPGVLKRSTVHRVLKSNGLSARKSRVADQKDLDRFEADYPNDLWQSDMLVGPWLPDPDKPGKMRRANLFAFIDDHSRLLLYGRFSFRENLPELEMVFRRALQKWGKPRRVYYDNGQVYRSGHMKQVVATLGMHRIIFTRSYRPMGHGKVEAFNRLVRNAFLAELKSSCISSLDALNEAFLAWSDIQYNRKLHSELSQTPLDRWRTGIERVEYVEEETLRQAFLWKEHRTPDKTGVLSLLGIRYQVGPNLCRKRVQVRFDPEALQEIEVWHQGRFIERCRPLTVYTHRRPSPVDSLAEPIASSTDKTEPTADWLSHLISERRKRGQLEPSPQQLTQQAQKLRDEADQAVIELLKEQLSAEVLDLGAIQQYLNQYGPFDIDRAEQALEKLFSQGQRRDQHVTFYLNQIRNEQQKGEA